MSDVGLICGRFDDRKYWKVWLYLGLFFSYIGGSLLASWSFNFLQTRQFLVNFSLFTVGGGVFLIIQFCVPIFHPTGDLPSAQSAAAVASSPSPPIAPSSPSHDAGDEQKSNSLSNDDHATSSSSRNTAEVPEVETTGVDLPPDFPWTYVRLQVGTNLLSFHSGFLNATTLLSSPHLYTLQITGNMTLLAIDIIHKRYFDAMIRAIFAMCYFFGSFLMGIIAKSPFFSLDSSYYQIFLIGLALLITAFTTHLLHASSYFYYFLLILFSGYQSAFDCRIHGVLVRTTFMSGTVTDVGTSFGRFLRILFSRSRIDLGILPILFPTIISFIFGSFLATLLYPYASRYQILVNIAIFFTIGVAHTLLVWWYSAEI